MRWIFLFISLLMFWSCSDDYGVEFIDDKDSRLETFYSLENRPLSLRALNETFKHKDFTSVCTFKPDSVSLYELDSLFNPVLKNNANCETSDARLNCQFGAADYDSPLVKFVISGSWMKNSNFVTTGQLEIIVDIGQDSADFDLNFEQAFKSSRILHYVKEEGLPYYIANRLAQKDLDSTYNYIAVVENQLGIWLQVYLSDADFEEKFAAVVKDYGESLQLKMGTIPIADFVLENMEMGCGNYNGICTQAYGFDTCSSDYFADTIFDESSKFYGTILVCNRGYGWKLYNDSYDSLPLCSTYRKDLTYELTDSSFLICKDSGWVEGSYDRENRKYLLGKCEDNQVERILDRYFYCRGNEWMDASLLDYDIGICGVNIEYGQMFEYNDTIAVCGQPSNIYWGPIGEWHWSSELDAYAFRTGQLCNRKSDTLQILKYKSEVYGCFDNDKTYQWMKLNQSDGRYSYFVEETDSSSREMYGQMKDGMFYVGPDKNNLDYRNIRYVYNTKDSHLYGVIVLEDKIWLDSALAWKGSGKWENVERLLCPDGFHIPSVNEWGAYANLVKRGEARAIKTDTTSIEAVSYKTSTPVVEELEIAVFFTGQNGVGTLQSAVWPQNAETSIVCVKDF
ncbi:MAG: hypothetical protein MJY78_05885 [Fibrobacter sp.]|nr:hypothetical protein [Fibrobacter sp.]